MLNIKGVGTSIYKTEYTGVLVDIVPRTGTYQYTDPKTGETITRPNSWDAIFKDGTRVSWPTYVDNDGEVCAWNRFDPSIDLQYCCDHDIAIHLYRSKEGYFRLELAE